MEPVLAWLAGTDLALGLRYSRWAYAAVNTGHVLGIALLVGAILPLDLRLMGVWPGVARDGLVRVLVPVAAAGLALAVATGLLLFSVRAVDYAELGVFRLKLALIATGTVSALALHLAHGFSLGTASRRRLAAAGALSLTVWLGTLVCGRMIAFVGD